MKTPAGTSLRLHVDGIVDPPKGGSPFGEVSISTATFDGAFADHDNDLTLLNVRGEPIGGERPPGSSGASPRSRRAVVETRDEFKTSRTSRDLDQTLKMLYALLGLSVIVSLFGVDQHARALGLRAHARARDAARRSA